MRKPKRCNTRLDAGMQNWIAHTARANLWRVPVWYDLDDLIQEGLMCYAKCAEKYEPENQAHFMATVKTAFINRIHTIASKTSRSVDRHIDHAAEIPEIATVEHEQATFMAMLNRMPVELGQLVLAILQLDRRKPMHKRGKWRETNNEYLCRIAGLDPKEINLTQLARQHLLGKKK